MGQKKPLQQVLEGGVEDVVLVLQRRSADFEHFRHEAYVAHELLVLLQPQERLDGLRGEDEESRGRLGMLRVVHGGKEVEYAADDAGMDEAGVRRFRGQVERGGSLHATRRTGSGAARVVLVEGGLGLNRRRGGGGLGSGFEVVD